MLKKRQAQATAAQNRQQQNVIVDLASVDLNDEKDVKYTGFGGGYTHSLNKDSNGDAFARNMKICVCIVVIGLCVFYFAGFKLTLRKSDSQRVMLMTEVSQTDTHNSSQCGDILYELPQLHAQTRLLYNMLPKTGTMGMRDIFSQLATKLNYNSREGKSGDFSISPFHYPRETLPEIISDNDSNGVIHQNFHFIDYSWFGLDTPYYINLIRDPVDHYISWYYHRRHMEHQVNLHPLEDEDRSDAWREMSFETCVRDNHPECLKSQYTFRMIPFFCGQAEYCLTPSRHALEQAKRNVVRYYPLLGYVENLEAFLELAEVMWPQFMKGSVSLYKSSFNENANPIRKDASMAVKITMRERLGLEYEFYVWVKQRFHCMYKHYLLNAEDTEADEADEHALEEEQVEAKAAKETHEPEDDDEDDDDDDNVEQAVDDGEEADGGDDAGEEADDGDEVGEEQVEDEDQQEEAPGDGEKDKDTNDQDAEDAPGHDQDDAEEGEQEVEEDNQEEEEEEKPKFDRSET